LANKKTNKVRVIAGRLRGRNITFADHPGLRPTGDRLRETLFSWLQPYIVDNIVLDLFAGSGALGFEACSRGARQVTMVEQSRKVFEVLQRNATQLQLDNVTIVRGDAMDLLGEQTVGTDNNLTAAFGIVFIDPPFTAHLHQAVIDALSQSQRLAKDALVVIESDRRAQALTVPEHWRLQKDKIAGEVQLQLYLVP